MHIIPRIDYKKVVAATSYYALHGFKEIEVPWIISYNAYKTTKPSLARDFYTTDGYLNASGEQSFIEMLHNGVKLTKNFCITPCFRNEEVFDETHYQYFFKVELIDMDVSEENLTTMIATAKKFFEQYISVKVIQTDEVGKTFDIVDEKHGIELGSYGIRDIGGFSWIYGTGVALPRLDVVINK